MTSAQKKAFVERMAKARRKASKPNPTNKRKAKPASSGKKNPAAATHRKKERNPQVLSNPKSIAVNIVTALLSAVATRQLPQMLLKDGNSGWKGYLANAATGAAATFAAHEFLSPGAAQAALVGSGVIVLDRVLTEKFSPIGQYLSLTGLGDATAATSLGTVSDGYYIHPTIYGPDGQPIVPHQITDAAVREFQRLTPAQPQQQPQQPRQIAAPGMGGIKSRFADRFSR